MQLALIKGLGIIKKCKSDVVAGHAKNPFITAEAVLGSNEEKAQPSNRMKFALSM